jgi:purine nucleosidase
MQQQVAASKAPFAAYIKQFGQQFPMWDELAVGVWLDPSIVTRRETLLVDIDTGFTASYGDTLSWSVGTGPGLGERAVEVVFDVDVPKFERLSVGLLSGPPPKH